MTKMVSASKFSDPKSLSRNDFVSLEENPDQDSSTEHDFRRMPWSSRVTQLSEVTLSLQVSM